MSDIKDKTLLVLGGGAAAYMVVDSAKKMGVKVISVDYLDGGVAKDISDESYKISTNDYDNLLKLIDEKNVNGVFAGASEFNVQNVINLSAKAGLNCYCTGEQWSIMQNKRHFKDVCKKYGVPTVPEYSEDCDFNTIEYPVIVKPTDGNSSRGITVVRKREDMEDAIKFAHEYSEEKRVVIERFMECRDVTAFYIVQDNKAYLSHVADFVRYTNRDGVPTTAACLLEPSYHTTAFLRTVDESIKKMIDGIGLKNGFLAFQTFVDGDAFYVFECCLRITGAYEYPIVKNINGYDYMDMMIQYALTGKMGDVSVSDKIDPTFKGMYGANLVLMLNEGIIKTVSGVGAALSHENVVGMTHPSFGVGDEVLPKYIGTLSQTFARFHIVANSTEDLRKTIEYIFATVSVKDENGSEMIVHDFNWNTVKEWEQNI